MHVRERTEEGTTMGIAMNSRDGGAPIATMLKNLIAS